MMKDAVPVQAAVVVTVTLEAAVVKEVLENVEVMVALKKGIFPNKHDVILMENNHIN